MFWLPWWRGLLKALSARWRYVASIPVFLGPPSPTYETDGLVELIRTSLHINFSSVKNTSISSD